MPKPETWPANFDSEHVPTIQLYDMISWIHELFL